MMYEVADGIVNFSSILLQSVLGLLFSISMENLYEFLIL